METTLENLKVKIFADGADLSGMIEMASLPYISGLTTNPTLMKKAGISSYVEFAKDVLREVSQKPISFEVFSDEMDEMKVQAEKISSWGDNVFVKIPISNTRGESTRSLIEYLTSNGIKVNVTALMTNNQVMHVIDALNPRVECYISVFAGRIADTGRDPIPVMKDCLDTLSHLPKAELIWASPRELLNVFQADQVGCHIITATNDLLGKLKIVGKNLEEYSLETVKMFHDDAVSSKFTLA